MSVAVAPRPATLADLAREPGKAELINGRVVRYMATGHRPNVVAGRVFRRLADHADATGRGVAYTDNIGFAVPLLTSGRQSFAPDAAFFAGTLPVNPMRFVEGAPDFAVEVRSENDYGPAAEAEMADKRADYFEAGTAVVWDVDPVARVVRRYRPGESAPTVFGPG
jgi:Uma2 family endonuclease